MLYNAAKDEQTECRAIFTTPSPARSSKGARNQVERYRSLGLSVSDRNLPLEAVNDLERMRETLELVITQAKEIGKGQGEIEYRDGAARRSDQFPRCTWPATITTPGAGRTRSPIRASSLQILGP